MSNTPKLTDECKKLLDNDWMIVLYKSEMHDYAAVALNPRKYDELRAMKAVNRAIKTIPDRQLTGDFEPSQALTRLTDKVFGCGDSADPAKK